MNNSFLPFSVLMSVYKKDNPLWLREALESIITQTIKPDQIVLVVDGYIGEELEKVLSSYSDKLDIMRLEKNAGLGTALNKGLEICKHPLVARMDSDDISLSSRFEQQLSAFASDNQLSVSGGYIQEFDHKTKKIISVKKVPLSEKEVRKFIKFRSPVNHPSVMFKKTDVLAAGGYQPLHFMEDYFLWIRMINKGFKICNIPFILVNMRTTDSLYSRRGGYKYFLSNKAIYDKMLQLKMISRLVYLYNISVRFTAQVLMPNKLRKFFYKFFLR